jgi:hypothetical protein
MYPEVPEPLGVLSPIPLYIITKKKNFKFLIKNLLILKKQLNFIISFIIFYFKLKRKYFFSRLKEFLINYC